MNQSLHTSMRVYTIQGVIASHSPPCHAKCVAHSVSSAKASPARPVLKKALSSLGALLIIVSGGPACGADVDSPKLFAQSCAGCHAGGGNIVQRSAGLSLEELQKNQVASSSQIYDLIYSGKGKMPGYGINCAPRGKCTFAARLPDDQIKSLTDYVLEQASTGWKR